MLLYYRLYIYSLYELLVIRKYFDEHLEKSFIRVNKSFEAALIFLAYKPGGDICVYIDYKGLNNIIIKNRYLILLICETFDTLYHVKIYIKLDIIAIFNRLYIVSRDKWKITFIIRFGLFECLVINFGIIKAFNSFQYYINHIFFDFFNKFYTMYLNDILIYSKL